MPTETARPTTKRRGRQPAKEQALTFAAWAKAEGLEAPVLSGMFGIHRATVLELLAGRRWPSARTALQIMETSDGQVRFWDVAVLAENIRVRVRPPEPRPAAGKRR